LKSISLLERVFSFHGYLQEIVSDNTSIFQSEEFHEYCSEIGIFKTIIAPGHPATNGLAERNVQTPKQKQKPISLERTSLQHKVQNILFRYRATALACGRSPAELYLHRKL
jgi:transposase InsO family protein